MRINHNISALNTYARLDQANTAKSKSLEKLSSGQRINRAGDDAAGLAISEKMRSQIRGLDQASRNSQDGISMIQTAEGALNESESILQRMRELSVQSANDTNTSDDRGEIQNEINQLSSEINRIAGTTEFNTQKLLDGQSSEKSVNGSKIDIVKAGSNVKQAVFEIEFNCIQNGCTLEGLQITCNDGTGTINLCGAITVCGDTLGARVATLAAHLRSCVKVACQWDIQASNNKLVFTSRRDLHDSTSNLVLNECSIIFSNGGCTATSICTAVQTQKAACANRNKVHLELTDDVLEEGVLITVGDRSAVLWNSANDTYSSASDMLKELNLDSCTLTIDIHNANSDKLTEVFQCLCASLGSTCVNIGYDSANGRLCIMSICAGTNQSKYSKVSVTGLAGTTVASGNGKNLQIGANTDQMFTVFFDNMSGKGVGVTSDTAGESIETSNGKVAYFTSNMAVENNGGDKQFALDVTSSEKATAAISAIDDAIKAVSSERSKLGSYQNRLEHTITNLNTSSENLTAAESRIRDVDMAKEMMEFTKNNILSQAATNMLAQANQQPQGVLSLIR